MLYVDKNIKAQAGPLFIEGYDERLTGPVSQDLTVRSIIADDDPVKTYTLKPEEMVMVETDQVIDMPENLLGRIGEKNSRIRQGLSVSGPHYFPGHRTRIFLRVFNMSPYQITLKAGDAIAQIFFEGLKDTPEKSYDATETASFNDEDQYNGFGKYKSAYEERMTKMQSLSDELDEKENRIYVNIITLMGIFVSISSLIMVNFCVVRLGNQSD